MTTRFALVFLGVWAWGSASPGQDVPPNAQLDSPEGSERKRFLDAIRAVEMPQIRPEERVDRKAVEAFVARRQVAIDHKSDLIGEFARRFPEAPELLQLLPERWQVRLANAREAPSALAEIDETIAKSKNPELVHEASFIRVLASFRLAGRVAESVLPAVDAFARRYPADNRGAEMLAALAEQVKDPARKREIEERVTRDYPDSPIVKMMLGERRRRESVGKPFPFAFTDAIKGLPVTSESLRGKVVVVDFWATWSQPSVAEIPKLVELHDKYKDKGVAFVGVSLDAPKDQGGLDRLRQFVAENKVDWPQYYDGPPAAGDFATSWGVLSLPAVFVVDPDGHLVSLDAGGQVESTITSTLARPRIGGAGDAAAPPPGP